MAPMIITAEAKILPGTNSGIAHVCDAVDVNTTGKALRHCYHHVRYPQLISLSIQ